jgi:hypothetical protein
MSSNLITIRSSDSAHWYTKDGAPRHDATLREARKEGLYGSVTNIIGIKAKPQLTNWLIAQALGQALTLPRIAGESDDAFISRVMASDAEERAKAPDLGSAVHAYLASWMGFGETLPAPMDLYYVCEWLDKHTVPKDVEYRFCYPTLGYAGCIDFRGKVDGREALIDYKTQGVKNGKPTYYPEFCWQLIAYAAGQMEIDLYSVVIDTANPGMFHEPKLWKADDKEWAWKGFLGLRNAWFADKKYMPEGVTA